MERGKGEEAFSLSGGRGVREGFFSLSRRERVGVRGLASLSAGYGRQG
jgi:hypothetical protein